MIAIEAFSTGNNVKVAEKHGITEKTISNYKKLFPQEENKKRK